MDELCLLHSLGFKAGEARRLKALKLRYQHGDVAPDLTCDELHRREFVRWLVRQGRLSG
jgi:hypothetical protein